MLAANVAGVVTRVERRRGMAAQAEGARSPARRAHEGKAWPLARPRATTRRAAIRGERGLE